MAPTIEEVEINGGYGQFLEIKKCTSITAKMKPEK